MGSEGKGKNHFVQTLGAILAHKYSDSRGIGMTHLLGGEEAFSVDSIQSLCSNDGGFSSDQLKKVFVKSSSVDENSTVAHMDHVRSLGFNKLSDLGITINRDKFDTVSNTNTLNLTDATNRLRINTSSTTPALRQVLLSEYGDELLKEIALYQDGKVDLKSLETLLRILTLKSNSNTEQLTVNSADGKETGELRWQAYQALPSLYARVEKIAGIAEENRVKSLLDILAKHSEATGAKSYEQINGDFMDAILTDLTYSASVSADSSYADRAGETVFDYITYNSRTDLYALNAQNGLDRTIEELYPNEYYKKSKMNSIQSSSQKIILSNFKMSPANFIDNLVPQVSMWNAYARGTGANAQAQSNLDEAFGPSVWIESAHGRIFSEECSGLGVNTNDFAQEKARIFVFLFTMLDADSVEEMLEDETVNSACAQQASALLKYIARTSDANSKFEFKDASKIRDAVSTNVLGKAPYITTEVKPSSWISISGKIIDKTHFGMNHDNSETIRDSAIQILSYTLFNSNASETCRLQLVNEVQLAAVKVQQIAAAYGATNDIKDFSGSSTNIMDIYNWTDLNNAMKSNGDAANKICNPAFVNAAYNAIAKATTTMADSTKTYYAQVLTGGADVAANIMVERNLDLVDNVTKALEGASTEQNFEFFYMMAQMKEKDSVAGALAKSIVNHLSIQLSDSPVNVAHHMPSGWASYDHSKITTTKDRRSTLTSAVEQYFTLAPVCVKAALTADGASAAGTEAIIAQDDINNIKSFDGSSKSKIAKVDLYVAKIAKLVSGLYSLNDLV
jgi:hypothetical protein